MTKFITVSGPQSSGKTTLLNYLKKKYPHWQIIDEINPASITKKKDFGALNTSVEIEKEIIEANISLVSSIERNHKTVLTEQGIFNYVFNQYFLYKKLADEYYHKLFKAHNGLDCFIVFINIKPEISWQRRKEKYIKRITNKGINDKNIIDEYLEQYKKIIFDLYPLWIKCYKKIPFKKITIENSYKEKHIFLEEAEKTILSLLSQKSL